jgi:FAD/FMN-containing dehydrogenase
VTLLLNDENAALELLTHLRLLRMDKAEFFSDPSKGELGVMALEFFDVNALAIARNTNKFKIHDDAAAALQTHFFADDQVTAKEVRRLMDINQKYITGIIPSSDASDFRTSTPGIIAQTLKTTGKVKLGTDFAVPPEHFSELYDLYRRIRAECGQYFTHIPGLPTSATWGHAGDCNLHMNLFPSTPSERELAEEWYGQLVETVIRLRGTVTAEHGTGKKQVRAFGREVHYLEHMYGERGLKEIASVKRAFDPNGLFNPGNLGVL